MSATTTANPSRASAWHAARPMPAAPPVTMATDGTGQLAGTSGPLWERRRLAIDEFVFRWRSHLDHRLVAVIPFEFQRLDHVRVHHEHADDVGQLYDLLFVEMRFQLVEQRVRRAAMIENHAVGIGQYSTLGRRESIKSLP